MASELAHGLHVGDEGVVRECAQHAVAQDSARNQILVVHVFGLKGAVDGGGKGLEVRGRLVKGDKPLVVGQAALTRINLWGDGEFAHLAAVGGHGLFEGVLDFGPDDVLAEGRYKVLDASGHANAVGCRRHELDGVANAVAPKAGVGVHDERVVDAGLHLGEAEAGRIFVKKAVGRNEFVVDSVVEQQQQILAVGLVLVGDEALGRRVGLHDGNLASKELFESGAVGLECDSARDKEVKGGEYFADARLAADLEQALEVHLYPGRNSRDDGHRGAYGFAHDGFDFVFPVLDAVGVPSGLAVLLKVGRHEVRGDSAQATRGNAVFVFEYGASLQKDHVAVDHAALAGGVHVGKKGVAG